MNVFRDKVVFLLLFSGGKFAAFGPLKIVTKRTLDFKRIFIEGRKHFVFDIFDLVRLFLQIYLQKEYID
jgi:hypothetical protein